MIDLTPAAHQRLDEYLQRMRFSLRGTPVPADEIEQSVREHVDVALSGSAAPVGAELLANVLDRLGPPERWLPEDEQPAWKRWMNRLRSGPDDWRLAYATFGLFLLMFLTAPIGGFLLIVPAYVVSRAYIEFMHQKGEPIGARRWLVYPPIALVLAVAVAIFIVGPVPALIALAADEHGFEAIRGMTATNASPIRFMIGLSVLAFGTWWVIASLLAMPMVRLIRATFYPLVERVQRRHFAVLTLIGVLTAGAGAATIFM